MELTMMDLFQKTTLMMEQHPLAYEAFQELTESVNPLRDSYVYGVDIYSEVLQFFYSHP